MSSSSDLRPRPARIVRPHIGTAASPARAAVAPAAFDDELILPASVESVLLDEAWKDGFARGVDEGIARGLAMAAAETAADDRRAAGLRDAISAAGARVARSIDDAEDALLQAAFALAEAIIGAELTAHPRRGVEALRMALQLAPERAMAVAHLNPADVDALGDVSALTGAPVTIVADPAVACGDCIVEMPASRIEVCLHDAIERARTTLFGDRQAGAPPAPVAAVRS